MKRKAVEFFIVLTTVLVGCSGPTFVSSWNDSAITIDGSRKEWGEQIHYLEDEKIAFSVKNDDDFLYLFIATADRERIMQIMSTGLTVWFDPQNSDGRTFGIQYPIRRMQDPGSERNVRDMSKESNGKNKIKKRLENFKSTQNEILIVNEDNFPLNAIPLKTEGGVKAEIGIEMEQLVYELRVPLANSHNQIFADALPNEEIKLTFESGEIERPERGEGMARNPGMEMSGGRRGGMRGGNRGGIGNMPQRMDPINFEVNISLSSKINN